MLIQFSVSNFLSFNEKQTFSMAAGKARKFSDRIYKDKKIKLTKSKVIFGANASGKSNLISAFQFFRDVVLAGLPSGYSEKYFRMDEQKKNLSSEFEIEILYDSRVFRYGFTVVLSTGSILKEYLYEESANKKLFERDTIEEKFEVGSYFKEKEVVTKLMNYGVDSSNDKETLFLTIINKNKGKMFNDFPDLKILRELFNWFKHKLNISFPQSILTGYPYFKDSNLQEIAKILDALGTGITNLKLIELPLDVAKSKIPADLFNKIITDLEKENTRAKEKNSKYRPQITVRSYKEFYSFEIDTNNRIVIKTIEFSHENQNIYFDLNEESDGTARLLDLIEIFLKPSEDRIFIIDEIDRCLHPTMTVKLIELFLEMAKKRNTQLIITSHESRLLASEILRNDEICFVSKDKSGQSIFNPLEKYQLRADKKIYAALFDGTLDYGPTIDEQELRTLLN